MTNKIWIALFWLPLIALAIWALSLAQQRASGYDVKVAVEGYDPRDLLSGHYIQYQINWEKTDCSQFTDSVCPKEDFCIDARWGRQCRFYVPENAAPQLDKLFQEFRSGNKNNLNFEVLYSYKKGRQAIAKQLLINGKDWHEFYEWTLFKSEK